MIHNGRIRIVWWEWVRKAEVERINCERGFKIDEEIIEYYRGVPLQGKD